MQEKSQLQERLQVLEEQNRILKKSKESQFKKSTLNKQKMEKKIEKLMKDNSARVQLVVDREKEIQNQQIRLREFMQKNLG